ncbi:MAG: magnesium transporter [Nitrospinaceae bacterium]|jgi:magnesium transporter|nr:magnesium transporter [Nitrospinaceae bacterium]MBT3433465.1 magnesium transporter [Nitrospinaceae bacterium]MBT4094328.1 magnesium transporter [Nitrospinaceae bacterium]MBT4432307.1 magnesium transporter [Nitrospinaceae bacterium]MBT5367779.1 magnesium transporter [Nitrospinaceae bacterium]
MVQERDTRLLQIEDMIRRLLRRNAGTHLGNALAKVHPAEAAQIFRNLETEERQRAFAVVSDIERQAEILSECDQYIISELLEPMSNEAIATLLKQIGSDDTRHILEALPEGRAGEVVEQMDVHESFVIEDIMAYAPDSAGSIMSDSFVAFFDEITIEKAISEVRKANEVDYVFYVYVLGEDRHLRGVVSLRQLLLAEPHKRLSEVMTSNVWSVTVHADQEDVARLVSRYNILAIPVVDDSGVMLGVVTVDDVIDVLREEATEDILKMAGTHAEEITNLSAGRMAWIRFPWLFVSWMGGMGAAWLIGVFENELSKVIALAAFMPVIIGMAGNVGTQSATIIVRGLATGRVSPNAWLRVVSKQLGAGVILGVAYGFLLGIMVFFQFESAAKLGLVVGLSITIVMTLAALLSSIFPLLMHRFRFDPAVSTGPFVTTGVDIIGILVYFTIARYLLF